MRRLIKIINTVGWYENKAITTSLTEWTLTLTYRCDCGERRHQTDDPRETEGSKSPARATCTPSVLPAPAFWNTHTHIQSISAHECYWSERLLDRMFLEGISFSPPALSKCQYNAECSTTLNYINTYRESKLLRFSGRYCAPSGWFRYWFW